MLLRKTIIEECTSIKSIALLHHVLLCEGPWMDQWQTLTRCIFSVLCLLYTSLFCVWRRQPQCPFLQVLSPSAVLVSECTERPSQNKFYKEIKNIFSLLAHLFLHNNSSRWWLCPFSKTWLLISLFITEGLWRHPSLVSLILFILLSVSCVEKAC